MNQTLYIAKRSSGGRGVYELAGHQDKLTASDLRNHDLELWSEYSQTYRKTDIFLTLSGDKYRLKIHDHRQNPQLIPQIAALLLLPEPTRQESSAGTGIPVVLSKSYLFLKTWITNLSVPTTNVAQIRIGNIDVGNQNQSESIDIVSRFKRIDQIYKAMNELPTDLAHLIDNHWQIASTTTPLSKQDTHIVLDIIKKLAEFVDEYDTRTDPLPALESLIHRGHVWEPDRIPVERWVLTSAPIKQREIRKYRDHVATRAGASTTFRRKVQQAYNFQCFICGTPWPKTSVNPIPGVDAAHILPWASYDLDEVSNGLCLCKLHHWAFDGFLLVVRYQDDQYIVRLNPKVLEAYNQHPLALEQLRKAEGVIPNDHLPRNRQDWPNPRYLSELYDKAGVLN